MKAISQNYLKKRLDYDPSTGEFTWKHDSRQRRTWNTRYAGKPAGTTPEGVWQTTYTGIRLDKVRYLAHRLAWLYVYGVYPSDDLVIDHINGVGTDNRISNLRLVTPSQSNRNLPKPRTNKSGVAGVHFDKRRKKWMAHIRTEVKFANLGRFDDYFEAVCKRKSAELNLGYHANHGR